jgi:hypothetical protein
MLARGIPGFIDHTDDQVAPLEHIFEHGDGSAGSYFSVGIDVAARWSLETNLEGEIALRDLLHRTIPEVAARLTYDTESAAVWVLDPRRTDLEQVLRLIVQQ